MRLPVINTTPSKQTNTIDTFGGLNQQLVTGDAEFADMCNISDRYYPAIGTRPARGEIEKTLTNPKGIFYKNGLFYIDGAQAYYKDKAVFNVSDSDKIFVGIGAYICVFPDNIMFNTFTGTHESMTAELRLSTTFAPLSDKSVFTKITASGIGNTFKTGDNVKITGCSNSEYNDKTKVVTESGTDYIIVTGSLDKTFTQTVGFSRLVPDMDFVTERDNRLWGCSSKNHEVYCCKIGDPKNWYNYESEANSAWAATVGSDGDFTGISKFGTYLIFFKESSFHILRGDKPSNFSLLEKDQPGVRKGCERSVISIQQTLYYVSRDGVYAYTGSIPYKISENIEQEITDAVACQYQNKLYLSCKLDGVQTLLIYTPGEQVWMKEDDTLFQFCQYSEGDLHYVDASNNLRKIYGTSDDKLAWFLETPDKFGGSLDQKRISKIKLNLWLPVNSEVYVYMKFDDGPMWIRKGYIRSTKNKTYTIPIIPMRCSKYRIRLEGTGQFKMIGMSYEIEAGSELNGSIHTSHRR